MRIVEISGKQPGVPANVPAGVSRILESLNGFDAHEWVVNHSWSHVMLPEEFYVSGKKVGQQKLPERVEKWVNIGAYRKDKLAAFEITLNGNVEGALRMVDARVMSQEGHSFETGIVSTQKGLLEWLNCWR